MSLPHTEVQMEMLWVLLWVCIITLIQKGHQVQVITPNDYPSFLHWMKGNNHVIQFTKEPEAAERITLEAEIIFCLDFNTLSRIDTFAPVVEQAKRFQGFNRSPSAAG